VNRCDPRRRIFECTRLARFLPVSILDAPRPFRLLCVETRE
jgi:hypothetical protein